MENRSHDGYLKSPTLRHVNIRRELLLCTLPQHDIHLNGLIGFYGIDSWNWNAWLVEVISQLYIPLS